MPWHVSTEKAPIVKQPPDTITISNTEGLGTWEMLRPEAVALYRELGKELGLIDQKEQR